MRGEPAQTIAFLDSGVGGLAALRETMLVRPHDRYVYLADEALFPFSGSDAGVLSHHVQAALKFFITHDADWLVLPAGDLAGLVATHLDGSSRRLRPLDPRERGLGAAIDQSATSCIGIICSPIQDLVTNYTTAAREHTPSAGVSIASSLPIALLVQQSAERTAELTDAIRSAVQPLRAAGVDAVFIDCSHTAMVDDLVRRSLGSSVTVTTSSLVIAQSIADHTSPPAANPPIQTDLQLFTTDGPHGADFRLRANQYLQMPVAEPMSITLGP